MATVSRKSTDRRGFAVGIGPRMAFWLLVAAVCTALLWLLRDWLDKAHMALVYLLVVLGASSQAGGRAGLVLSILCFLCFNFFLLPPYYTFELANPLDWLVLGVFLLTGMTAARLLARAQQETNFANQRAAEVDRLAEIGAESLKAPKTETALDSIAAALRSELAVDLCEVYDSSADGKLSCVGQSRNVSGSLPENEGTLRISFERGAVVWERGDGSLHLSTPSNSDLAPALIGHAEARGFVIPLEVRGRPMGVLRVAASFSFSPDERQARFVAALAYYAALALERARLAVEAEGVEALREADRIKDALIANISHDLRTPLTTIKALASELREQLGDERACVIEDEADRLNRLVTDVLDLSRIRAGALKPHAVLVAAEDLLGAALQQLSGRAGYHRLDATVEDDDEILVGRFDFLQSLRILVNLIDNALRHAPPDTAVHVRVRRAGDNIAFSIEDRGPGIATEDRERIFLPFETGAGQRSAGAGLGLSIARELTQAQGGLLRYDPRPGGGSIFTLELPGASL